MASSGLKSKERALASLFGSLLFCYDFLHCSKAYKVCLGPICLFWSEELSCKHQRLMINRSSDNDGCVWNLLSACCVPRCLTFIKLFHLSLEARRLFPFWGGLGWEFLPWHMALAPSLPSLCLRLCLSLCPRTSRRRAAPTWGLAHPCCSVSAGCPRDIFGTWNVRDRT